MPKIYEMPSHLADLIAAGEVVERPGSVVKELTENSIDAGATVVTVEIRNGGMSSIKVTDNGCGISSGDVELAFLRHATSKLRDERGLEAIGTLGFRGEALAAIASVSRVELITRERGAAEGTRLVLDGGVKTALAPAGCPDGTAITVRDLFFNTPARLKFMKNDRAEGTAVTAVMLRMALSHPEVSFRYLRDGKEELHTPGDGRMESAVYCTLGRELAQELLPASGEGEGIKVSGFVSTPAAARGNRSWQFFFVNGRFIRSKALQSSLEEAYRNSLFTGRYPVCILNLETGLSKVDVNVHPTKMEVRFADERAAAGAVYWAAKGALERESAPPKLTIPKELLRSGGNASGRAADVSPAPGAVGTVKPREDFFRTVQAESFRSNGGGHAGSMALRERPSAYIGREQTELPLPRTEGLRRDSAPGPLEDETARQGGSSPPQTGGARKAAQEKLSAETEMNFRYVGEALDTYLIAEKDGSIFLIDKHAAHERLLFDRLKAGEEKPCGQLLMTPAVCQVGEDDASVLLAEADLLREYGFELDDFGGGAVALRQLPQDIDPTEPTALLEELADKLRAGGRRDLDAMRDGVLHTIACKAAIKAGRRSEPEEVYGLIARVLSGEIRYCPHGRPVSMELTQTQLDKCFKRV